MHTLRDSPVLFSKVFVPLIMNGTYPMLTMLLVPLFPMNVL